MSKKPAAAKAAEAEEMATVANASSPAATPDPFAHQGDGHWGTGGRYIVVDGKRVPAPVTHETEAHDA